MPDNPENNQLSFLIDVYSRNIDALKTELKAEISDMKKDIRDLQIKEAKSDVKVAMTWGIITALIMGGVAAFWTMFKGGVK